MSTPRRERVNQRCKLAGRAYESPESSYEAFRRMYEKTLTDAHGKTSTRSHNSGRTHYRYRVDRTRSSRALSRLPLANPSQQRVNGVTTTNGSTCISSVVNLVAGSSVNGVDSSNNTSHSVAFTAAANAMKGKTKRVVFNGVINIRPIPTREHEKELSKQDEEDEEGSEPNSKRVCSGDVNQPMNEDQSQVRATARKPILKVPTAPMNLSSLHGAISQRVTSLGAEMEGLKTEIREREEKMRRHPRK